MNLGVHVSISGSIDMAFDRAEEKGCDTFQIFTRNPRGWVFKDISYEAKKRFLKKSKEAHIAPVIDHMPYLPNLASPKDDIYEKSISSLCAELRRCKQLEIPYLITHLGSHLGEGKDKGFKRIVKGINFALNEVENDVMLLLENTAGTRNSMGTYLEDIRHIIESIDEQARMGVCFDTSHAFAAGYDLRTETAVDETMADFDDVIGFKRLKIVHINDSRGDLCSCVDRHEHIGMGFIGEEGFKAILKHKRIKKLPLILETPVDERRDDYGNMAKVRELAS
ncbi:MAG: deoxyribonuclease IV [Candidatus Hydrothermarchaeales archaeon]